MRRQSRNIRECRTFAGWIIIEGGRPYAERWPTAEHLRTVHVFLNEREAMKAYGRENIAFVTVTGIWHRKRAASPSLKQKGRR